MTETSTQWKIAVLSDTHGLLRPEVLACCQGANAILHAGDVGNAAILVALAELAPLTAIRGNVDTSGPCAALPETDMVQFGDIMIYLVHSIADLDINPVAAGVQIVVSGHSHKAAEDRRGGVLYLNPGSAGPRRFRLPISIAFLHISGSVVDVKVLTLDPLP